MIVAENLRKATGKAAEAPRYEKRQAYLVLYRDAFKRKEWLVVRASSRSEAIRASFIPEQSIVAVCLEEVAA
jgi:hypothetical protein